MAKTKGKTKSAAKKSPVKKTPPKKAVPKKAAPKKTTPNTSVKKAVTKMLPKSAKVVAVKASTSPVKSLAKAAPKKAMKVSPKISASKNGKASNANLKSVKATAPEKSTTVVLPNGQLKLGKTYLKKDELRHFEKILLAKRDEVLRDLEIMRASLNDENNTEEINSSYSMHMADHGTETLDREQRFMFIARDERYLGYIDKALERIKGGTYGICVKSGLPIPKERLEAVPHTAVRIEYKNK
jgi:DnaK suppressor protein